MVVEIVQQILPVGVHGEPGVGHTWMPWLPQICQVVIVGLQNSSPLGVVMEIVQRHIASVGTTVNATTNGPVETRQTQ
eukprot:11188256-Lingulodinium_polyedra.AAC.1